MQLDPLSIRDRSFPRKRLGGLDEDEVRGFLEEVARAYEALFAENRELREELDRLRTQVKGFSDAEQSLREALAQARRSAGEIRENAQREAELILRSAELDAEKIVGEGRRDAQSLTEEIRVLRQTRRRLKLQLKSLMDGCAELIREDEDQ